MILIIEVENIEDVKKQYGLSTLEVIERYVLCENLEKIEKEIDLPATYYHTGILPKEKPLKITVE